MSPVTQILRASQGDDVKTAEALLPLVYDELRRLAARKMSREASGHTLQATALVHEVWLRLSSQADARWQNQHQFYAVAAESMRRILVDRARRRQTRKHGGESERVELEAVEIPGPGDDRLVLEVNEILDRLASEDPVKAEVVKLRYFVGLGNGEIAALLGVSEKTVQRHWSFARAWLYRALKP